MRPVVASYFRLPIEIAWRCEPFLCLNYVTAVNLWLSTSALTNTSRAIQIKTPFYLSQYHAIPPFAYLVLPFSPSCICNLLVREASC